MVNDYLPERWGKELKLFKLRMHYRKKHIYIGSYYVEKGAQFGHHVRILHDVQIRKTVSIGDYSYVEPYTTIISASIGKYCSIGKCCQIGPWEHPLNYMTTSPQVLRVILQRPDLYQDLPEKAEIGNDVWIGSNAIVMGGVKVGNGAVIGAGAIVTKDVPSYAIVVGNPAKIIRYRFQPEEIAWLESLSWWDWTKDEIYGNKGLFLDRENFISERERVGKNGIKEKSVYL